jgi:hypothetical protein
MAKLDLSILVMTALFQGNEDPSETSFLRGPTKDPFNQAWLKMVQWF